ncbi:MAG: hypothetical protein U9Q95_03990, partial [Candidatus Eisenbacteria bacterium]|nr:hypothetical protein [Candidatus Eisenbacteria bacterium]
MNHHDDALTMVRRANPLPDLERFDPDEVAAGVAAIEEAWQADKQVPVARPLPVPRSRRRVHYAIAFVAAAVTALVLIGGPIFLRQPDEAPVIEEPPTTVGTTTTTAPQPSTSTTVPSDEAAPAPSGVV